MNIKKLYKLIADAFEREEKTKINTRVFNR